jgi:leucyl-tRNA synthetase
MDPSRAAHWQEAWRRARLASAERRTDREKFFALIAYPGTSGFLHVGHLRSYAYLDALHRYHRMLGKQVLFPFGVHASGLPAVTWSQKLKNRDPSVVGPLEELGIPPSEWPRLEEPEHAARFLGHDYLRVIHRMGALVDDRTFLTTVDDDYRAFVRWQFHALHDAGALVQASYFSPVCPVCGPVAVDPSETDLSSGGDADIVRFVTVPFRLDDGRILLAATLRPETVYGVTNLWLPPEGELVVWHRGAESYLLARPGAERLVEQHGGQLGHPVRIADLLGRSVSVPLRGTTVPILPSPLVDPNVGTGVVMSVPAHAPADALAIRALSTMDRVRVGEPPVLLEVPTGPALTASEQALIGGEGNPAERALQATGARSFADRAAVDEATERLYRLEFVRGRMTVAPLAGVPVREAREHVASDLAERGGSFELQEFSKPVICRNGHEVVIRRVPDQWFLRYSDPEWKRTTLDTIGRLTTWPSEYARELPGIIDWYQDRPCTRRGPWLGTPFPDDPSWTIEPIADSTLYMAYFIVRPYVADGRIPLNALTDAFFDYVFRGQGAGEPMVDRKLLDEVRADFLYWYPLDYNMGGKEHKRVHFPVFLYTHARLLSPELQPRGIYVNGWITGESGGKLSKKEVASKGSAKYRAGRQVPPIDQALARWGPDPLRLYYVAAASPAQDLEWDESGVDAAAGRLEDVERLVRETRGDSEGPPELDSWLLSEMHRRVDAVRTAFDATDLRTVAEIVYVEIPSLLRRYYARGGAPGRASDRVGLAWIRLLAPITPHLAEELGEGRQTGLVASSLMPAVDDFPRSPEAEAREAFLGQVEEDLRAVMRPATERGEPVPDAAIFFVASPWKATLERWMRDALDRGESPNLRDLMERSAAHPEVTAHRGEIPKYVQRVAPLLRSEPRTAPPALDELGTLRAAEGYLSRRFGFRSVSVHPESEGAAVDPLGRRDRARPGRPAFYLTRPGEPRPES